MLSPRDVNSRRLVVAEGPGVSRSKWDENGKVNLPIWHYWSRYLDGVWRDIEVLLVIFWVTSTSLAFDYAKKINVSMPT
jgi:hypothetical protein